ESFAKSLPVAFGSHKGVGAPGALYFESLQRDTHGQRRVLADDRRPLARHPDAWLARGVVGVAAVLPVPSKPVGLGRVGAMRAPVQRIDAASVVGPEPVDL